MNPGTFIVIRRDSSEVIRQGGNRLPVSSRTRCLIDRLSISTAHSAERIIFVSERGEVTLVLDHSIGAQRQLLPGLKHSNPYSADDRRMPPDEVWAAGYAAGLEDAKP